MEYKPKVEETPILKNPTNQIVANVSGVVDGKMQPLVKIADFEGANVEHIAGAPREVNDVLTRLFSCFAEQGHISEGLIGDVIYGFNETGYPPDRTMVGLSGLEKLGFLKFQAPDNAYVSLDSDKAGAAWVRYQPKLRAMFKQELGGIR